MGRKSIEKTLDANYKTKVQNFIDIISEARVYEKDTSFKEDGVFLPSYEWRIKSVDNSEYIVDSDLHWIYSIEADDKRERLFLLEDPKDHKRIVAACKHRVAKILQQAKSSKQKTK